MDRAGGAVVRRATVIVIIALSSIMLGSGHAPALQTKSSKLIDACELVPPAEVGAALGGSYGKGASPKRLTKGWKPDKVTKGYGVCHVPFKDEDTALLDLQVWRYATPGAAIRSFDELVAGYEKEDVKVVSVEGVGDAAAFQPAHRAPKQGVTSPTFLAVSGRYFLLLADARGDHTSPDGRKVADQTGESERLATLATTALARLPQ